MRKSILRHSLRHKLIISLLGLFLVTLSLSGRLCAFGSEISGSIDDLDGKDIRISQVKVHEQFVTGQFSGGSISSNDDISRINDRLIKPELVETSLDLNGLRVGIFEGSVYDAYVRKTYPQATRFNYATFPDLMLAASTDKVDVFLIDNLTAYKFIGNNDELAILGKVPGMDQNLAAGFSKSNTQLRDDFNQFLQEIRDSGVYDGMVQRWFKGGQNVSMPDIVLPDKGPFLTYGADVIDLPFVAYSENGLIGFDVEMVRRFAASRGYRLQISITNFPALIPALVSGKVDITASGMASTEERGRHINFSDPYGAVNTVLIGKPGLHNSTSLTTRKNEHVAEPSFMDSLKDSFHSNIIHENRYLLIIEGLRTTGVISVWSILFGTLMGGLVAFFRMHRSVWMNIPAKGFIAVVRGTPILVILMLTFYVVFASVNIDPVLVSILAFGVNFAAYVSEMYRSGIEAVDKGQYEAGIAMGFSRMQTFRFIIAPQALRHILPVYKGEVISLVKMTSIVGYIAVQDLTKAGDIIRSRTFDAFFPLIMVAILYFLMSYGLLLILNSLEFRLEPKRKTYRCQP